MSSSQVEANTIPEDHAQKFKGKTPSKYTDPCECPLPLPCLPYPYSLFSPLLPSCQANTLQRLQWNAFPITAMIDQSVQTLSINSQWQLFDFFRCDLTVRLISSFSFLHLLRIGFNSRECKKAWITQRRTDRANGRVEAWE